MRRSPRQPETCYNHCGDWTQSAETQEPSCCRRRSVADFPWAGTVEEGIGLMISAIVPMSGQIFGQCSMCEMGTSGQPCQDTASDLFVETDHLAAYAINREKAARDCRPMDSGSTIDRGEDHEHCCTTHHIRNLGEYRRKLDYARTRPAGVAAQMHQCPSAAAIIPVRNVSKKGSQISVLTVSALSQPDICRAAADVSAIISKGCLELHVAVLPSRSSSKPENPAIGAFLVNLDDRTGCGRCLRVRASERHRPSRIGPPI